VRVRSYPTRQRDAKHRPDREIRSEIDGVASRYATTHQTAHRDNRACYKCRANGDRADPNAKSPTDERCELDVAKTHSAPSRRQVKYPQNATTTSGAKRERWQFTADHGTDAKQTARAGSNGVEQVSRLTIARSAYGAGGEDDRSRRGSRVPGDPNAAPGDHPRNGIAYRHALAVAQRPPLRNREKRDD
jgi:hypothetical protein